MRIGHEHRGHAVGGYLEHRATGARHNQVRSLKRRGELLQVEV